MSFALSPILGMPEAFGVPVAVEPLTTPKLAAWNAPLAEALALPLMDWAECLGGSDLPPGSTPFASVYAGHQFGHYVRQLGDGRAHLLGTFGGYEWQLKGSGRTPYSRFGDGKAVWRSSIREYLCSEAMAGLGIPTTRALALVVSDDVVFRETPERAAVVTRLAPSFLRFGHLQYFFHTGQHEALRTLLDALVAQHFPGMSDAELYEEISRRTAALMAEWMAAGFCHGVMNTDNMSLLGLTLDYGPFGFLGAHDPHHICNHSDEAGRYAYDQQPRVAQWNLAQLAAAFSAFVPVEQLQEILNEFPRWFGDAYLAKMRRKLGLTCAESEDAGLIAQWFTLLAQAGADHTQSFRRLPDWGSEIPAFFHATPQAWQDFHASYTARLVREAATPDIRRAAMRQENPAIVLHNYIAQEAIDAAEAGEFAAIDRLRSLLSAPYADALDNHPYAAEVPPEGAAICVSCSS